MYLTKRRAPMESAKKPLQDTTAVTAYVSCSTDNIRIHDQIRLGYMYPIYVAHFFPRFGRAIDFSAAGGATGLLFLVGGGFSSSSSSSSWMR